MTAIENISQQLYENRNDAFDSVRPDAIIAVPIAAHNEPKRGIEIATEQYATQNSDDFVTALTFSINAPQKSTPDIEDKIRSTEQTIKDFQKQQDFPVSFFTKRYSPHQALIGNIRYEHIAGKLTMYRQQFPHLLDGKTSLITGDIDLIQATPGVFQELNAMIASGVHLAQGNIIHARTAHMQAVRLLDTDKSFPNADEVVYWYDLGTTHNPLARQGPYYATSIETYEAANGFDPTKNRGEDFTFQAAVKQYYGHDRVIEKRLSPELVCISSPRRILAALAMGGRPIDTWDIVDFKPTEDFRNEGALRNIPDLSEERTAALREEIIKFHLGNTTLAHAHVHQGRDGRYRFTPWVHEKDALEHAERKIGGIIVGGRCVAADYL